MPKRKSTHPDAPAADAPEPPPPRRSTRQRTATSAAAASSKPPQEVSATRTRTPKAKTKATPSGAKQPRGKKTKAGQKRAPSPPPSSSPSLSSPSTAPSPPPDEPPVPAHEPPVPAPAFARRGKPPPVEKKSSAQSKTKAKKEAKKEGGEGEVDAASEGGRQYWLMRAEPETRLERGVDVSFSIDDLAAKKEPEPWDGIRNYTARNNLRAMKKGDLAFFSHSNCKKPGIVGIMEIVKEHSPDLTAHDPKAAYYDPKSSPSDPKWSVVHVEFRRKFAVPVTVKEMREMAGPGGPLEKMQMMKQSRLSVSRVSAAEWEHLMSVVEEKNKS